MAAVDKSIFFYRWDKNIMSIWTIFRYFSVFYYVSITAEKKPSIKHKGTAAIFDIKMADHFLLNCSFS